MKVQRLKATVKSKALLGLDKDGNVNAFDVFYSVGNWPETLDEYGTLFPDATERIARYEDAHNTKGQARRIAQAYVDAAEAASRALAEGFTPEEAAEALLENAENYGKMPGARRAATPDEIAELRDWVMLKLSEEPIYEFGATISLSKDALKRGADMVAFLATADESAAIAINAGMAARGFTAWNLVDTPNPTAEQCAHWIVYRLRHDAAAAKTDPLAALA